MSVAENPTIKLLLVDEDSEFLGSLMRRLNKNHEFTFEVAKSTSDAIRLLAQHRGKINAIISDIHIPKKSGLDLVHAIRSLGFQIPFFILTADEEISEKEVLKAGASGLFSKPGSTLKISSALRKALVNQKQTRKKAKSN